MVEQSHCQKLVTTHFSAALRRHDDAIAPGRRANPMTRRRAVGGRSQAETASEVEVKNKMPGPMRARTRETTRRERV
jgi:hypothetical protein